MTHGILAAHCADETGSNSGFSKVRNGDKVVFSYNNSLYNFYQNRKLEILDLNEYIKDWKVLEVIEDAQTGYLGIIYCNDEYKQLVLTHRSTNFELGLKTKNLFLQSGVQTDIESVLKGHIVNHQAYGYLATTIAVNLAKELDHSLSITGHSLGAWLADLSVFYCNTDLKYPNVKGVTFDGPGSLEMIEQMSSSDLTGFSLETLDVVSYLSPPNIVNCTNKHIGIIYRLFPSIEENGPNLLKGIVGDEYYNGLVSTYGHDLKYILPHFSIDNGRPKEYQKVVKWPSIRHKEFGDTKITNYNLVDALKTILPSNWLTKLGVNLVKSVISKLAGYEMTTLGSIATLAYDFLIGKIDQKQFWEVHRYLDKNMQYQEVVSSKIEKFSLLYKGHYQVEEHNRCERGIIDNIDKSLVSLAKYATTNLITDSKIYSIVGKYEYKKDLFKGKIIFVKSDYQGFIVIDDLRDAIRELFHRDEKSVKGFSYNNKINKLLKNIFTSSGEIDNTLKSLLKHLSYLNPDEDIPAKIYNQLFNHDSSKNALIEQLSDKFIIKINKSEGNSIKISDEIQKRIQRYINDIEKQDIFQCLLKVLNVMPVISRCPDDRWNEIKLYYKHAQKVLYILHDIKELSSFIDGNKEILNYGTKLNTKLGLFYKYVLINPQESLKYFLNALELYRDFYNNQNNKDFADSFYNVALGYMRIGKFEEALLHTDQALKQKELLYGIDDIMVADSLDLKGILLEKLYEPIKSITYTNKAFEIRKNFYDKQDHHSIAFSHNNLALICFTNKNWEKALHHQSQALEIMKRLHINDTPLFADCWYNLGIIYIEANEVKTALECLKKSLIIRKKLYGYKSIHYEIASSFEKIGFAYQKANDIEVGVTWQEEGYNIREQLYQNNLTLDFINSKYNLGLAYIACKEVKKGLKTLEEALALKQKLYENTKNITMINQEILEEVRVRYEKSLDQHQEFTNIEFVNIETIQDFCVLSGECLNIE